MRVSRVLCLVALAMFAFAGSARASIIFDDFNVDAGHFGYAPAFSSTTNFTTASTSSRITSDSVEGAGSMSLALVHSTATTNRCRFLSAAPPYTSANVTGVQQFNDNVQFTLGAGTDGFIGYYYKVTGTLANASGTTMSLNLDGSDGAAASMDGATPKPINADGAWHLVEWNLDSASDWGVVAGIGGGGHGVLTGSHTIDSIYMQLNNAASASTFGIELDFVAKSDSGSIALLIPEPTMVGMFLLAPALMLRRRRG
jgi:hypothetical protein